MAFIGHLDSAAEMARSTRLARILTIVGITVFVTNFDFFLAARGFLPVGSFALFITFCVLFVANACFNRSDRHFPDRAVLAISGNVLPLMLFLLWTISCIVSAGRTVLSDGDVDYAQIFPLFQFFVLTIGMFIVAADHRESSIITASRCAIVLLSASIVFETVFPGSLGTTASRTGGIALNANIPGFILPALLAISLSFGKVKVGDFLMILVSLLAITSTLSRMGLIFLFFVIIVYVALIFKTNEPSGQMRRIALGIIVIVVSTALIFASLLLLNRSSSALSSEFQERVETLLEGRTVLDDPYRIPLLNHYLDVAQKEPWIGSGAGETLMNAVDRAPLQLGPHNMYLRAWIDTGLPGLLLFSAYLASVVWLGFIRRSISLCLLGVLTVAYGAFSHNVIDNKAVLILTGIALAQSALPRRQR